MQAYKTISEHEYDKLGQLKNKKLAPTYNNNTGLETLIYDYNIRGWMLGANRDYLTDAGSNNYFGFELGYDKLTNKTTQNFLPGQHNGEFNGNINGMIWKSKGDQVRRKYDFEYDAANRLLRADFVQNDQGSTWGTTVMNYSVKMGDGATPTSAYDANGNIIAMTQYGYKFGSSSMEVIDNLTYNYMTNSNKLLNVIDASNDPQTRLGDFRTSSLHPVQNKTSTTVDYTYDANGNLKKDLNKDIGTASAEDIVYNHLNLPQAITVRKTGGGIKGTITYTYDAAGNKLNKEVNEAGQPLKTTLYVGGSVYENDVLQFLVHEEGRIRFKPAVSEVPASLQYDYMLKDHLGNVRMVLTEELQTDAYPAASMETTQSTTENLYYSNINNTRVTKPAGYPTDNYTNPNDYVARTNGNDQKIGPTMILKVMAGDKFNLRVNSWYKTYGVTPGTPVNPLDDLLSILINSIGGITNTHGGPTTSEISNSGMLTPSATNFLNSQTYNSSRPKAFINWILLDEQLKYYGGGFEQAANNEELKTHLFNDIAIEKCGYLYVYVSNETPNIDVFFDNLQVTHVRGPLLETNEYYPYGLLMRNISYRSYKGIGYADNKYKYNSIEYEYSFDLNIGETFFRTHDPQTGRWWQIDPKIEGMYSWSPYASNFDNPVLYLDPRGDWPKWLKKVGQAVGGLATGVVQGAWSAVKGIAHAVTHPVQTIKGIAYAVSHPGKVWNGLKNGVKGIVNDFKNGDIRSAFNKIGHVAGNVLVGYGVSKGVTLLSEVGQVGLNAQRLLALNRLGRSSVVAGETIDMVAQYSDELSALARQATKTIDGLGKATNAAVRGTNIHVEWAKLLKEKYGSSVRAERSFLDGVEYDYSPRGSIRVDAIMHDASGNPVAIYDLKTGAAGLTEGRIAEIRAQLPENLKDVPIKEIREQ